MDDTTSLKPYTRTLTALVAWVAIVTLGLGALAGWLVVTNYLPGNAPTLAPATAPTVVTCTLGTSSKSARTVPLALVVGRIDE